MWQMIAGPGLRCAECRHGMLIFSIAKARYLGLTD